MSEYIYKNGFRVGQCVRIIAPTEKYNRLMGTLYPIGTEAIVIEPPNEDGWPDDAVQIRIGSGQGAWDWDKIELRVPKIKPVPKDTFYKALLEYVQEKLEGMSNEQRERFFKDVHDDYCTGCGTDNLPCHCQNDE